MIEKHYKNVKKGLRKGLLPDSFFTTKYAFSPYHACEHGCLYCDGRAEKYYVEGIFEKDIVVRKNLPDVLSRELPKLREPGTIAISSGVSDPYQPVEKEERLMRRCAEVLTEHCHSIHLMTKSALALRDIDLWSAINKRSQVTLMVSLVFTRDKERAVIEPQASSVEERIELLKAFKAEGMDIALCAMPFLPEINDSPKDIEAIYALGKELGVSHVLPGDLTLRPGRQKDCFINCLKKHYPKLISQYKTLYKSNRPSGVIARQRTQRFQAITESLLQKYEMPRWMPHEIYKGNFALYDEIHILLSHMLELYSQRAIETGPLKKARENYSFWLQREKKLFNRKSTIEYSDISGKIRFMAQTGELEQILQNTKLAGFLNEIILRNATFDYRTLKII